MPAKIPFGATILVRELPPELGTWPAETQAAFRFALGKRFQVSGHGRYGHLELELGPACDAQIGGFMNSIWIEPEFVAVVRPPKPKRDRRPRGTQGS